MSKPVNLNRFRKARAKSVKVQSAHENSERFGQSKKDRLEQSNQSIRAGKHLDDHRLDE